MSKLGKKIGSFITGSFVKLYLRQKSEESFEIGQLIVAGKNPKDYIIFQINDLMFGSQMPDNILELMAGYKLERESSNLAIYEPELRNYVLALARPLIHLKNDQLFLPKKLPEFFSDVYELEDDHLSFLKEDQIDNPIMLGTVRSGSKELKTEINLEALEVFKHHVLIPATTGRGKSNLVKVILYNIIENEKCGKLVFDPHNEYYESLKKHPKKEEYLEYYTIREVHGKLDLKFNMKLLSPYNFIDTLSLSNAQKDALILYHRQDKVNEYKNWIKNIFIGPSTPGVTENTVGVLKRKLSILLDLEHEDDKVNANGIYQFNGHESTINNIINSLEEGKTVIIDTSLFTGNEEIFVATLITERIFSKYKNYKFKDELKNKPVISIVLEEAPRVIGKRVLEARNNIFGTIAREGRKFQIGLIAITQLPSEIPRDILANMNTKIILGNEMGPERRALIDSAAQDLSDDSQTIASLDKGEAIITSNFTKFAIPIKIPLFSDLVKYLAEKDKSQPSTRKRSPGLE